MLKGIINATQNGSDINKFLFHGSSGTGKTLAVKHLGRILNRKIMKVNFSNLIDSDLFKTKRCFNELFAEINSFFRPNEILVLFDEIDTVASVKNNLDDTNLPGLVISILHQGLENIDKRVLLIATSNKYEDLDQGLISRFDRTIDFNQYSKEDLLGVAEGILTNYLAKAKGVKRDLRLFRKILSLSKKTLFPKDLENLIKSSLAFSASNDGVDYLRKLYVAITGQNVQDVEKLQDEGFTPRELKSLTSK